MLPGPVAPLGRLAPLPLTRPEGHALAFSAEDPAAWPLQGLRHLWKHVRAVWASLRAAPDLRFLSSR